MTDFLDDILEPQKKAAATGGSGHYLVVGVRAKDSAEQEAAEATYLSTAWLPIPFVKEDGTLDRSVMAQDAELIAAWRGLGMTLDEYENLMTGDSNEQQPV